MRPIRLQNLPVRLSWRLRRWAASRHAAPWIAGGVERPDRVQRYSRSVDVRGWVSAPADRPVTVDVWLGDSMLQRLALTPTPGAAAPAGHVRSTFDAVIPLEHARSRAWLRIVASSASGVPGARVLGITRLVRARPGDTLPPRAAYGAVWDAVATTLSDAQFSVAGTTDAAALADSGRSTADDVARETGIRGTDTVLEIGCGVARVGASLAPHCGRWIGADVSGEMLRHARAALAGHANVSLIQLNGVDLAGVDDASVDVAYCTGVFMHLDEWDRFRYITEMRRVLKPGGRIYFDNFNLRSDEGWQLFEDLYRMEPAARPPNISRSSTPQELQTYAERAKFDDIRVLTRGLWVTVTGVKPR